MKNDYRKKIATFGVPELEAEITRHNRLYFEKASPEIADEDFDRLVRRLKKLNPESPLLQKVGSDLSARGRKIEHSSPMLSLDKCYQLEELVAWAEKFEGDVAVSPKIDGLAIAIHYDEDGKLFLAETRGDGIQGDEITENVRRIAEVPQKIHSKRIEVRGEVYMRRTTFERYREGFANPRNLAAGALKQKNPDKTAGYELAFFAYELIGGDEATEFEKITALRKLGFVALETRVVSREESLLKQEYDDLLARREELDYELDGVVYKANSVAEQIRLGASAHHPRWAIAYKFQGDAGVTTLRDIEWSVSRTGAITPIGLIEPVFLSGANVSRVSLHNVGLMQKMGVVPGSRVLVMRRGGVIPNLEKVLEPGKQEMELPKLCPSCQSPTVLKDDFLFCTQGAACRKTKLGELRHFAAVFDIEGFGPKLLEQLHDAGYLEDEADFFSLTVDDLMALPRMGEVLAHKLIRHVDARRKVTPGVLLRSLGIPELAKHASEVLVKHFRNLKTILSLSVEQLEAVHTFGPVIARNIVEGLQSRRDLLEKLLSRVTIEEKSSAAEGKLSGKSFLFTGKMVNLDRSSAEKKVEAEGGEIASSVTKNLDYLVIGQEGYVGRDKGNKWLKAESLIRKGAEIQLISEEDFLKLLEEPTG